MSVRASRSPSTPDLTCTSVGSDGIATPLWPDRVLQDQKNRGAGWEFCPDSSRCFHQMQGTREECQSIGRTPADPPPVPKGLGGPPFAREHAWQPVPSPVVSPPPARPPT